MNHIDNRRNDATLEEARPFQLTEQSDIWWGWRWSRLLQNSVNVATPSGLSAMGQVFPSLVEGAAGKGLGVGCTVAGNAASMALYWKTKDLHLIEKRMTSDFSVIKSRVAEMSEKATCLFNSAFLPSDTEIRQRLAKLKEGAIKVANATDPLWMRILNGDSRHLPNIGRIIAAGLPTGLAGLIGNKYLFSELGYEFTEIEWLSLVLLAAWLAGVGNGLSTYLAYEPWEEQIIKSTALELLPQILATLKKTEEEFPELLQKVKAQNPESFTATYFPMSPPPPIVVEFKERRPDCLCMVNRNFTNITNASIAGGMSGLGQWISFDEQWTFILVGAMLQALANILSTWWGYQRSLTEQVKKSAVHEFPQVLNTMIEVEIMLELIKEKLAAEARG